MMKSSSTPPQPDPNIGKAALMQAETGVDWLNFAKDAFVVSNERQAELDTLTKRVTEMQIGVMGDQAGWMRNDRERYERDFRPVEDEFLAEAKKAGTPEQQAAAAAAAKADVQTAAAGAKGAAMRDAASMGINPASGRYAGMDRAAELGTALATAGAQNQARQGERNRGIALKADAVNLGRGLPAQSAQAAGLGLGAGSSAVGLNQNNQQISNAATGIVGQGFQGQMAGYGGMGSTLNQQYSTQVSAWDAQQRHAAAGAAGMGSFLGGALGLFMSDEKVKEDKTPIPEGAALDAVKQMPVEEWSYKEGVADEGRHVGTYAQDFQRATGSGDGQTIAAQDAIGITMKAVQDLDAKVEQIAAAVGIAPQPGKAGTAAPRKPAREPLGIAA